VSTRREFLVQTAVTTATARRPLGIGDRKGLRELLKIHDRVVFLQGGAIRSTPYLFGLHPLSDEAIDSR